MSVYNSIFGSDPRTALIMGVLGFDFDMFGEFVDSFPHNDQFVVIARIAGNPKYKSVLTGPVVNHCLFAGKEESGDSVIFRYNKPTQSYALPEMFITNFQTPEQAWEAVAYLNQTKNRSISDVIAG